MKILQLALDVLKITKRDVVVEVTHAALPSLVFASRKINTNLPPGNPAKGDEHIRKCFSV